MIRIRKLNELMDNPVPYETNFIRSIGSQWSFVVEGITYEVSITRQEPDGFYLPTFNELLYKEVLQPQGKEFVVPEMMVGWIQGNHYEIDFSLVDEDEISKKFGITDTGNQFTVFSTVIEIIKNEIIPMNLSSLITFTAGERSRQKLYGMLAKEMSRKVPQYEYMGEVWDINHTMKRFIFVEPDELINSLEKMGIIV